MKTKEKEIKSWERVESICKEKDCKGRIVYSLRNFSRRCTHCQYYELYEEVNIKSPR